MPYDKNQDQNLQSSSQVASQARGAAAVTPSNTVDLSPYAKALYIGVAGDVTVIPVTNDDASPVTFPNHPVGYMPVQVRRVMVTGTTALGIVALNVNQSVP